MTRIATALLLAALTACAGARAPIPGCVLDEAPTGDRWAVNVSGPPGCGDTEWWIDDAALERVPGECTATWTAPGGEAVTLMQPGAPPIEDAILGVVDYGGECGEWGLLARPESWCTVTPSDGSPCY